MHPSKARLSALARLFPVSVGAGPACLFAWHISTTIKLPSPERHMLPRTWCKIASVKSGCVLRASPRWSTGFASGLRRQFSCHIAEGPWWQSWRLKVCMLLCSEALWGGDQDGLGWEFCLPTSKQCRAGVPDWVRALQSCSSSTASRLINLALQHFYW